VSIKEGKGDYQPSVSFIIRLPVIKKKEMRGKGGVITSSPAQPRGR